MPDWLALALIGANGLAALAWLGILLHPARAWRMRPVAEEAAAPPAPEAWPKVGVIVPAHNEAALIGECLAGLLAQDYPGEWRLVVVDERSTDETRARVAEIERTDENGRRLELVAGAPLPEGWIGKVWGLKQGLDAHAGGGASYFLLTDADIAHAPHSLRRLVAESEAEQLALNSRMARLHCSSRAERLMIPAFVFFFNLLYPMRRVNDPTSRVAAAAGGCVLVRAEALASIGGFERIRDEVIDDVNLARALSAVSRRLRLSLSLSDVCSRRRYATLGPIWRMVRRTAFDELSYSWARLAGTVMGMLALFALPPVSLALTLGLAAASVMGQPQAAGWQLGAIGGLALAASTATRVAYGPTVALYRLRGRWAWTLGLAGTLYGLITLDSARVHAGGRARTW